MVTPQQEREVERLEGALPPTGVPGGRRALGPAVRRAFTSPTQFLYIVLFLVLFMLVAYPVVVLATASFASGFPGAWGDLTLDSYRAIADRGARFGTVAVNSILFGVLRVGAGLALALLFAWAVARTNVVGRGYIEALVPIPFFMPDLITGVSWVMLANPNNGLINQLAQWLLPIEGPLVNIFGWGGLVFHSSFSAAAFMYLLLLGFFYNMDPALEEASIASGVGPYRTVFTVTLPVLLPAIIGTALLSFIQTIESFENPLLFASPAGIYVFANEIYRVLRSISPPQYNVGAAISIMLVVLTLTMVMLQRVWVGKRSYTTISGRGYRPHRIELPRFARWGIFIVFLAYFALAIVIPVVTIILTSFFPIFGYFRLDTMSLENWQRILMDPRAMAGLRNTVVFSTVAGAAVVIIGGIVGYIRVRTRSAWGHLFEAMAWLPWLLPGIALSLALLWAWLLLPPPFNLYGTATIIIIGFTVKGLPVGTRQMQSAVMQIGPELEECARVVGASRVRSIVTVLLPLMRLGIAGAFVVIFAMSARDLTIPVLLYVRGTETLTVALLEHYETGRMVMVATVAVIQLAVISVVVILERVTRPRYGG